MQDFTTELKEMFPDDFEDFGITKVTSDEFESYSDIDIQCESKLPRWLRQKIEQEVYDLELNAREDKEEMKGERIFESERGN